MTNVEIALPFSLCNTRDIPSRSNYKRLKETENNIDLQVIDRHQSTSLCAPIRSSVCQRTEFPKRTMISGRRIFFLLSPSPLSFFRPRTYRKGYYFYSPQSSTVIKSKIAATTILRTRTRFRPPKAKYACTAG